MQFTGERMIPEENKEENIYLEHISRYMFASQFTKGKEVLDIACGSGYGSAFLMKSGAKTVTGVDISEESVAYCKDNYSQEGLSFLVGDVRKIPLPDNSVDVIVSFETIEHVDEESQKKFLVEVGRVLRPEGMFVVSTPNTLVAPAGNPFHIKELTPEEFSDILRGSFSRVDTFYQDDVESSYILSKNGSLKNEGLAHKQIGNIQLQESLFLIAVCSNLSDFRAEDIKECVVTSDVKPWKNYVRYEEKLQRLDSMWSQKTSDEISELRARLDEANKTISFLESSKYMKLRDRIEKIKKGQIFS